MDVKISASEKNPNVTVICLTGRLDSATADATSAQIMEALDRSTAGLSILLALRQKADPSGKKMAIIGANPTVYKIFKITALDHVLHFFETEDDAIQALWA
jgi:anti-anti-sigma factor